MNGKRNVAKGIAYILLAIVLLIASVYIRTEKRHYREEQQARFAEIMDGYSEIIEG